MYIAIAFVMFACFVFLCHLARRCGADYCGALLAGAVGWGVIITALTELLSALSALTFWGVLTAWLIITCVLAATSRGITLGARQVFTDIWKRFLNLSRFGRLQLCAVAGLLGIEAFAGLFSAPSNWDSMTYHLARVAHWVQDSSVAYYPAGNLWQLYQPPWAEFSFLHLELLSGGDRVAFAVQWMSFVLCLVGVWSIAGRLGANVRGQLMAAVFATTLPGAVLQASSTQNNLVMALWLICFARFLLDFRVMEPGNRLIIGLGCGAALGLAMLTKGTAYPLAAPLVIWFAVLALRYRSQGGVLAASAAIVIALFLNVTHWSRNYQAFSSLLVSKDELSIYQTTTMSPALFVSNLTRNLAVHFTSPSYKLNYSIERVINFEHHFLGLDVNDRRISTDPALFSPGAERFTSGRVAWVGADTRILDFSMFRPLVNEDYTGNPLHLLLILVTCGWTGLAALRRREDCLVLVYMVAVIGGYAFFCATLNWRPWNTRLDLPLFILAAPVTGLALSRTASRISNSISLPLFLLAAFVLLHNPNHPLAFKRNMFNLDRQSEYFLSKPELTKPYIQSVDFLASQRCQKIGLVMSENNAEYPLWILMRDRLGRWPTIEIVSISKASDAWQSIKCLVILDPQLRDRILAFEPPGRWETRNFGDLTVQTLR